MSAFFAVLLSVIMLFNNVLLEGVKYKIAQYKADYILKQAIYSTLANYDYAIKDKYGLYVHYPNGTGYFEEIIGYVDENLAYESENGFIKMKKGNLGATSIGLNHMSELGEQIFDYCKYRALLSSAEEFLVRCTDLFGELDIKIPKVVQKQ